MPTIKEMTEVMQAYENGHTIEMSSDGDEWQVILTPSWNWGYSRYRIKEREGVFVVMTNAGVGLKDNVLYGYTNPVYYRLKSEAIVKASALKAVFPDTSYSVIEILPED